MCSSNSLSFFFICLRIQCRPKRESKSTNHFSQIIYWKCIENIFFLQIESDTTASKWYRHCQHSGQFLSYSCTVFSHIHPRQLIFWGVLTSYILRSDIIKIHTFSDHLHFIAYTASLHHLLQSLWDILWNNLKYNEIHNCFQNTVQSIKVFKWMFLISEK